MSGQLPMRITALVETDASPRKLHMSTKSVKTTTIEASSEAASSRAPSEDWWHWFAERSAQTNINDARTLAEAVCLDQGLDLPRGYNPMLDDPISEKLA